MNGPVPRFLSTLGIDGDADERAVRRAYATRLKTIDQAADAAGFQALREAFELAMRWISARDRHEAATIVAAAQERDAQELAHMPPAPVQAPAWSPAFHTMRERIAHCESTGEAHATLVDALTDPRLAGLADSIAFEAEVAALLARGWQPGHEHLLDAAVDCFQWHSRTRLDELGTPGLRLDKALAERARFEGLPPGATRARRDLIPLLRALAAPDRDEVLTHGSALLDLLRDQSTWVALVLPKDHVATWLATWNELEPTMDELLEPMAPPKEEEVRFVRVLKFLAVAVLVVAGLVGLVFLIHWARQLGGLDRAD